MSGVRMAVSSSSPHLCAIDGALDCHIEREIDVRMHRRRRAVVGHDTRRGTFDPAKDTGASRVIYHVALQTDPPVLSYERDSRLRGRS